MLAFISHGQTMQLSLIRNLDNRGQMQPEQYLEIVVLTREQPDSIARTSIWQSDVCNTEECGQVVTEQYQQQITCCKSSQTSCVRAAGEHNEGSTDHARLVAPATLCVWVISRRSNGAHHGAALPLSGTLHAHMHWICAAFSAALNMRQKLNLHGSAHGAFREKAVTWTLQRFRETAA